MKPIPCVGEPASDIIVAKIRIGMRRRQKTARIPAVPKRGLGIYASADGHTMGKVLRCGEDDLGFGDVSRVYVDPPGKDISLPFRMALLYCRSEVL